MEENLSGRWFISETGYGPLVHARLGVAQENSGKLVATVRQKAKLIAEKQITGIYKTLLTGGSIESFVKRINSINERYYQGVEVKTEYTDTNKLKVTYLGFEKKYHLHEIITMAWWEVVFENLGAKNVTTKITKSLLEGMGYFEFVITWEKTSP